MGELLGRSAQAEQLLADYDAHVAEVRAAIGEEQLAQLAVTSFRPYGDGSSFLVWVNSFSDTILADVGLRHPQAQIDALPAGEERINDLSLEMIPLLDADVIFTVAPWNDDTTDFFNSLTDNALWQQLRAVQNNRVYTVGGPWNEGSVIAAHLVLDEYLLPEEEIGPLAWALFTAPEKVAQFAPYRQPASQVRDFLVCVDGIIDCSNPQPLTVAPAALTPMPLAVKLNCPPTPSALSPTTSPRT